MALRQEKLYDLFRNRLQLTDWDNTFSSGDDNEISDNITEQIINAAKVSITNMTVTNRPSESEWITTNIKAALRQRKRLFKKAKRLNTANARNTFKIKRNQVTTLLRE